MTAAPVLRPPHPGAAGYSRGIGRWSLPGAPRERNRRGRRCLLPAARRHHKARARGLRRPRHRRTPPPSLSSAASWRPSRPRLGVLRLAPILVPIRALIRGPRLARCRHHGRRPETRTQAGAIASCRQRRFRRPKVRHLDRSRRAPPLVPRHQQLAGGQSRRRLHGASWRVWSCRWSRRVQSHGLRYRLRDGVLNRRESRRQSRRALSKLQSRRAPLRKRSCRARRHAARRRPQRQARLHQTRRRLRRHRARLSRKSRRRNRRAGRRVAHLRPR